MIQKNKTLLHIIFLINLNTLNNIKCKKIKLFSNNLLLETKKHKKKRYSVLKFKKLAFFFLSNYLTFNTKGIKITLKSLINSLWNFIDSYTNIF